MCGRLLLPPLRIPPGSVPEGDIVAIYAGALLPRGDAGAGRRLRAAQR